MKYFGFTPVKQVIDQLDKKTKDLHIYRVGMEPTK